MVRPVANVKSTVAHAARMQVFHRPKARDSNHSIVRACLHSPSQTHSLQRPGTKIPSNEGCTAETNRAAHVLPGILGRDRPDTLVRNQRLESILAGIQRLEKWKANRSHVFCAAVCSTIVVDVLMLNKASIIVTLRHKALMHRPGMCTVGAGERHNWL